MSEESASFVWNMELDAASTYKLYTLSDETLAEALVDTLSIESLTLSLAGVFDGYSVVLYNEWLSRAGPFPYSYHLYKLIYEDASFTLEDIVRELGEDGLSLLLRLPFDSPRPREEIEAARELLESFFSKLGLSSQFERAFALTYSEASKRSRSIEKVLSAFIAHMINRALNDVVSGDGTGP